MIISLLLLFVVVLSASATFAADDVAVDDVAVDDDGITDDVLTTDVSDDSNVLSDPPVVTKDNFNDYFDSSGNLTSDADELVFEGDFSGVDVSAIMIARNTPVKFTGNNATFKNVQFMILQDDVTIDGFNFVTNESNQHSRLIYITGMDNSISNIVLTNNNIQFIAPQGDDGYAIFAGADEAMGSNVISELKIIGNNFTYVGTTDGTKFNNVIRVSGNDFDGYNVETSEDILVQGNNFDIQMPSVDVYYIPPEWVQSITYAEGIVFNYCDDVEFVNNKVKMKYSNFTGYADTLFVVSAYTDYLKAYDVSYGITIANNEITGEGHGYIYGVRVIQDSISIYNNTIMLSADNVQANGIEIGGPSDGGEVYNNTITLSAPLNTYGINVWQMNGRISDIEYYSNVITLNSYLACGMEINEPDSVIHDNNITALGNFTYGIAASIKPFNSYAVISNNIIACLGNNVGFGSSDPILKTGSAGISTLGNAQISNNKILSSCLGVICVGEAGIYSYIELVDNNIFVWATGSFNNYGVKITETNESYIHNNNVTFIGTTDGEKIISNGVYIFDTKPTVRENNFTLVIPAADITYGPAPRYEETIIAEGIVIDYVDDLQFTENNVTVSYGDIVGYYDTIRAIDISNSNRAIVAENKINAKGNTYMYAIKLTGKDFDIQYNQINSTSNYYANAINIESPSNGFITDNIIGAIAPNSAYPIYAGMNGQNLSMLIEDNYIYGEAYYVVGVEVGGDNVSIKYNDIDVIGNHTIGIGAYVNNLEVEDNTINSIASNEGDLPIWDNFGTDSAGIIVKKGNFTIEDNDIETTGEYAAVLGDNNGTVAYNDLLSNQGAGNEAIIGLGNVNATENPETKNKHVKIVLVADAFTKVYGSGDLFVVKILDENGQAVGNKTIKVLVAGQTFTEVSDADGIASFNINVNPEEYLAMIKFDGDADYGYKSLMKSFTITKKPTAFTAPDKSLLVTATKSGVNYNIVLKDKSGNALAGKKVTITFNGKTSTATTNAKGEITYKIVVAKAGSYKLTLKFDGDDLCDAATATATIKVTKEATKLTANKKTFKAKAKTKKYTVTLKDSKGKAIKKVKLTLKIKNKTFKAKTNAKGKAIFKIKKLTKKGKYTAKVTFAGNNLYNKVAKSVKITLK